MSLQPGDIIEGKYRIVRLLGQGGMGAVYEGENTRIHRKVAIKVLHANVAAKADVVQRFEREAQAAGRIGSEHIVEVLDLGSLPSGERFMVMEYLEGESLGDRIKRRGRLSTHEIAKILHHLLEGLEAAHQAGIVHRDLKPDNVFLVSSKAGQRDFVKILDFGVSKFSALDNEMSMTRTGAVMGTPYYMSPEQARGGKIDARSDLYAIGVVSYQAVTGRVPFQAETFNELLFKIALEAPEPAELAAPGLDQHFAAIIAKAMSRDANARFQSAREFQAAIGQWMMMAPPDANMETSGFMPGFPTAGMPGFGMSSPGLGASSPGLGTSGLGTSNPGFGTSNPGLGTSNPSMASLSASSAQLGASQGGLAMTTPQPRRSGAMIAIGMLSVFALAGVGFGAYRLFVAKPRQAVSTSPVEASAAPSAEASAAPSAEASAAPSAEASAATSAEASATPSAEASAEPSATAAVATPTPTSTWKPPSGSKWNGTKTTPTAKPTGRVVGSEL